MTPIHQLAARAIGILALATALPLQAATSISFVSEPTNGLSDYSTYTYTATSDAGQIVGFNFDRSHDSGMGLFGDFHQVQPEGLSTVFGNSWSVDALEIGADSHFLPSSGAGLTIRAEEDGNYLGGAFNYFDAHNASSSLAFAQVVARNETEIAVRGEFTVLTPHGYVLERVGLPDRPPIIEPLPPPPPPAPPAPPTTPELPAPIFELPPPITSDPPAQTPPEQPVYRPILTWDPAPTDGSTDPLIRWVQILPFYGAGIWVELPRIVAIDQIAIDAAPIDFDLSAPSLPVDAVKEFERLFYPPDILEMSLPGVRVLSAAVFDGGVEGGFQRHFASLLGTNLATYQLDASAVTQAANIPEPGASLLALIAWGAVSRRSAGKNSRRRI